MKKALLFGKPYGVPLAIGLSFVIWLIPLWQVFPAHPLTRMLAGDTAQSIIGQRYFLGEPWHWPLLHVSRLSSPAGLNVAFTDSIPLVLMPLKMLALAYLPRGFYVAESWIAIAWLVQPAAAVFALRSAGEKRAGPAVAVAILSVCMPTLLRRFGQFSLCTHAIILVALGLYFRLVLAFDARRGLAAVCLLVVALLVHPYLLVMAMALLAAAPLTLFLRRDARWRGCAGWLVAGVVLTGLLAWMMGYTGSGVAGGYGIYSMNLLGPFVPGAYGIFPFTLADPTGGQDLEGYQYLGLGIVSLVAAAGVLAAVRRDGAAFRRHGGLLVILVLLAGCSLSGRVYLAGHRLTNVTHLPKMIRQFRATGRFFWPVSYVLMIWSVIVVSRLRPPALAALLLIAAVAVQIADVRRLISIAYVSARSYGTWSAEMEALAPVMARHDLLTLWPTTGDCGADIGGDPLFMHLLLLGSTTLIRTNTMYTARSDAGSTCDPAQVLGKAWQPREVRIVVPPARAADRVFIPGNERYCGRVGPMVLCSQDGTALGGVQGDGGPLLAVGETVKAGDAAFASVLAEGWDPRVSPGAWSLGHRAGLAFRVPAGGARVLLAGHALAPRAGGVQSVDVVVDGGEAQRRVLADQTAVTIPVELAEGAHHVELDIGQPTRPVDRGLTGDVRSLGFLMTGISVVAR